jgi:hypothetical protein
MSTSAPEAVERPAPLLDGERPAGVVVDLFGSSHG